MFKVGDKITPKDTRENRNYCFIKVGQIYTVKDCDERFVRLENVISGHSVSRFKRAGRKPTPEELAAAWRKADQEGRDLRAKLKALGFELKYRDSDVSADEEYPLKNYKFVKTETTTTVL